MPLPPTQNTLPRSLTTLSSPVSISSGPNQYGQSQNPGRWGAAPQRQDDQGLVDHDMEAKRQWRLLVSRRWRREQTVFKNVNDLATKMKTRVYLIFQHEGEEKVQVYNSHPMQDCITDFKYLMEFKYPRPLVRTPETMAEMLAKKRRQAEARLHTTAELVPDETLCGVDEMRTNRCNKDTKESSGSAPAASSPISANTDTEQSIDDSSWSELDEVNMCDWDNKIWYDKGDPIKTPNHGHRIHIADQPKTPTPSKVGGNAGGSGHPRPHAATTACTSSTHIARAKHATSQLQSIMDSDTRLAAVGPNISRFHRGRVQKTRSQRQGDRRLYTSRG